MKKKKIMILSISILLGILALIGASYALFSIVVTGEKTHTMKSAKLELSFIESSNGINLTNAYPVKDEDGMKTTSYTFTLKNTGSLVSSYDLSLEDQSITGNRMPDSVIKYYLKKDTVELEPKLLTNRTLDTGYIYPNESITYELKVWMDYDAGNEVQGTKFNTKVKAEGVQVGKPTDESCFNFDTATGTINYYACAPKIYDSEGWRDNTNSVNDIVDVIIPNTIDGVPVTKMGDNAFFGNKIKTVIIPNSVESIGVSAFEQNQLTSVTLPHKLTKIETTAFISNKLTSITIPEGVTSIPMMCFTYNKLTEIKLPNSLTSIGIQAFASNELVSVEIPKNITKIDGYAFGENANLSFIYNKTGRSFDWSMITIGTSATAFVTGTVTNSGKDIKVLDGKPTDESCFTFSNGTITAYSNTCTKDVVIPEKIGGVAVTAIGGGTFNGKNLTSVVIPNGIVTMQVNAFNNNQLTSVTLPNSIKTIGKQAFGNNKLTNLFIPKSVTKLEPMAFNNNQLSDEQSFIYKRNSDGSEDKTTIVSYGGAKRDNVVIPSGVKTIGSFAFQNNKITSITIPNSVTRIENDAFFHNQLTSVTIPSSVTSLGRVAFNDNQFPDETAFIYARNSDGSIDNTKLISYAGQKRTNVVIPSNVKTIGEYALYGINLVSVTIPSSVNTIAFNAFFQNDLTTVTIPSSVTSIGNNAFLNNKLTNVKIQGKSSSSAFTSYGTNIFGWASGYSDANITWNA